MFRSVSYVQIAGHYQQNSFSTFWALFAVIGGGRVLSLVPPSTLFDLKWRLGASSVVQEDVKPGEEA